MYNQPPNMGPPPQMYGGQGQMMVPRNMTPRQPPPVKTIYLQKSTKNKSFLDMHRYLKATGRKNNAFMLALIDPDLEGINPHDKNLNVYYKQKIFRECLCNYWYYLREVVRIPDQGKSIAAYCSDAVC